MSIGISLAVRGPKEERLATMKLTTYEILVVDDQEDVRKLIVTLFTKIGHHCITAGDGFEALKQANENKIDAVITDIAMPGMDGITLVKELLKKERNIPVLVLTGYDEYSAQDALAAGARDFLKKPFTITEIVLRFQRMMHDHENLLRLDSIKNNAISRVQEESENKVRELEMVIEKLQNRLNSLYMRF